MTGAMARIDDGWWTAVKGHGRDPPVEYQQPMLLRRLTYGAVFHGRIPGPIPNVAGHDTERLFSAPVSV
jgi:hypothetical protein